MSMRHVVACGKLSHPLPNADILRRAFTELCDTPRRRWVGDNGTVVINLGQNFKIAYLTECECGSA